MGFWHSLIELGLEKSKGVRNTTKEKINRLVLVLKESLRN